MTHPVIRRFPSAQKLAVTLARDVASALRLGLERTGAASLVVSGGRTPVLFMEQLSQAELNWCGVQVFLADERWVPVSEERSNANLVVRHLLQNRAGGALFHPIYDGGLSPEIAAEALAAELADRPKPLDAVVLGMGTDGHTASLFPDAPEIAGALGAAASPAVVMAPAAQPEARISLTPPALLETGFLALHIEGDEKLDVLNRALADGPVEEMPVRAILRNDKVPVQVYWCP